MILTKDYIEQDLQMKQNEKLIVKRDTQIINQKSDLDT